MHCLRKSPTYPCAAAPKANHRMIVNYVMSAEPARGSSSERVSQLAIENKYRAAIWTNVAEARTIFKGCWVVVDRSFLLLLYVASGLFNRWLKNLFLLWFLGF
jgi:hypothetical protein